MSESNNMSIGVGFNGLLGIVFITLKLLGIITWSWWWVTAPLWLPFVLVICILPVAIILISTLTSIIDKI